MDDCENGIPQWVIWKKELSEEEVRRRYFEMTGREPDLIHSPEESKTPFWWTGWLSKRGTLERKRCVVQALWRTNRVCKG